MIGADTILEVTRKLIGETEPYGDSCIDEKRAENLEKLLIVVSELLYDVEKVANNRDRQEGSMRKMGERAYTVLNDWWEYTGDYLRGGGENG